MRDVFSSIYAGRQWGAGESASGPGSGLSRTAGIRVGIPALLAQLEVGSVLDAGCGDLHWMAQAQLPCSYVGVDIVPELIADARARHDLDLRVADVTRDELPSAELVLCREVFLHLPVAGVWAALANFRAAGATWLLAGSFRAEGPSRDIEPGDWRPLDLEAVPFSFPPPERVIPDAPLDGTYPGKALCLWRLADIPRGEIA